MQGYRDAEEEKESFVTCSGREATAQTLRGPGAMRRRIRFAGWMVIIRAEFERWKYLAELESGRAFCGQNCAELIDAEIAAAEHHAHALAGQLAAQF